jgi:hypothetical protein
MAADRAAIFVAATETGRLGVNPGSGEKQEQVMKSKTTGIAGAAAVLMVLSVTPPALAWGPWFDLRENRVDRAENRRDERHDYSRRDVLEDRADRVEDRLDRADIEPPGAFDRHERRRWRAYTAE